MSLYNKADKASIIAYAQQLVGKRIRDFASNSEEVKLEGKGRFGQLLERLYFDYANNSNSSADFPEAGLELKCSPLKKSKKGEVLSKERLVLNIIDYFKVVEEQFESSSFFKKNASLLLVFYLYEEDVDIVDYLIKLVGEWSFVSTDFQIIKSDWEFIKSKIQSGRAHELSEGDTFYLGTCTKGANRDSVRKQPFSSLPAKQRAFSFKQGYVNHIIAILSKAKSLKYGRIIDELKPKETIEDVVVSKFEPYYGRRIKDVILEKGFQVSPTAKNYYSLFVKAVFNISFDAEIEEFKKADIRVKTVRIAKNGSIKESISFPSFKYLELVKQEWDESDFKEILESKFFFVFVKEGLDGDYTIEKVRFWNMPFEDIEACKLAWLDTQRIVAEGNILKSTSDKGKRRTNFIGRTGHPVTHVRPHGANAMDEYPLPVPDKLTGKTSYTKHCFWLNNDYVLQSIYLPHPARPQP